MKKETTEEKPPKEEKKEEKEVTKKRTKAPPELLRGFRDVLPAEQGRWNLIRDTARSLADAYSFDRIDLPVLERADLFVRTVGKQTDIVEKEMYAFTDASGDNVALRPEATASIVRAYINHGMLNLPQPVKLWYLGPMFRHDRPQSGRFRQFHQFGFEVLGVDDPIVDAQLITIINQFFKELKLPVTIQVNSIGQPENRREYLAELVNYLRPFRSKMSEDDKKRLQKNPLRVLDSKDPVVVEALKDAPQIIDWLDDDSKAHFTKVLEYLDETDVPYNLNPYLVRGLDYYNRTVFEVWEAGDVGERSQNALGGGGRYDPLFEILGAQAPTPGCGFALGIERVAAALAAREINPAPRPKPQVFFAQLGEAARRMGLKLFEDFRAGGIIMSEAFGKNALKSQLEISNKLGVPYTLILGQKEVLDGTIIVRDMESGAQEIVDAKKVVSIIQKKMKSKEEEGKEVAAG